MSEQPTIASPVDAGRPAEHRFTRRPADPRPRSRFAGVAGRLRRRSDTRPDLWPRARHVDRGAAVVRAA